MQGLHLGQALLVQHGVRLPHNGLLGLLWLLRGWGGALQGQVALGRLRMVVVGSQGQLLLHRLRLLLLLVVVLVVVLVVLVVLLVVVG